MSNLNWITAGRHYLSFALSFFVLVSVSFEGSYNLASLLILASYVLFFSKQVRRQITLSRPEKQLLIIAVLYVFSFIMEVLLHDVKPRILDAPAKVLLLIPALLLCNALRPGRQQLIYSFMFSAVVLLIQSLYEKYYLGALRVNGDVNAIQYGAIAIAIGTAGIALCATRNTDSRHNIMLYIMCCLLCCGAIYAGILSQSRGSIITLPLLALCLIALQADKFKFNLKKTVLIIFGGCLLAVVTLLLNSTTTERLERAITELSAHDVQANTSTSIRLNLWQIAGEVAATSPVTGVGKNRLIEYKAIQVDSGRFSESIKEYDSSHNAYMNTVARRGLIGLAILCAFMWAPVYIAASAIRQGSAEEKPYAFALLCFGLVFAIANLTQDMIFLNNGIIMYTGLLIILSQMLFQVQSRPSAGE